MDNSDFKKKGDKFTNAISGTVTNINHDIFYAFQTIDTYMSSRADNCVKFSLDTCWEAQLTQLSVLSYLSYVEIEFKLTN